MEKEIVINQKYGYVRVNSKSQAGNLSIRSQKEELIKHGVLEENIFVEVGSAADPIQNRPGFLKLFKKMIC